MNFILSRMLYEIKINFKKATCDESLVRCIYMYDSDRYLYITLLSALLSSFASRMQLNNCFSFVNYILRDELFVTQYSTLVECLLASHLKNTTQIRLSALKLIQRVRPLLVRERCQRSSTTDLCSSKWICSLYLALADKYCFLY